MRAAPGTERYRLTARERRLNRDMNSASVSLFSTRETQGRKRGRTREQKNKQEASLTAILAPTDVDVQSTVQIGGVEWRGDTQFMCPFLTEIACNSDRNLHAG